ncbi:HNH endonuclease signature motif containing protein [Nesterenkonia flava]|uniref:HNH endonuclease signature motif containing protein n=1 Tax=Nesterenkonia flava TaxID=469799 RepID=A0ABU1FS07_9MICC|nr:HNH endonuclease signature motif containing protein [Nesterenkonia flava]MDR5711398.1 HNH endonuclease signature motif containing protein [Nesterenkonia flava]
MEKATCNIEDCTKDVYARGNCNPHYQYNKKHHPELLAPLKEPETECSVSQCQKNPRARGMCPMHYARWRKYGDPTLLRPKQKDETCSIEDCDGQASKRKMCTKHYQQWRKENLPRTPKPPCSVEDCDEPVYAKGLCTHHYNRMRYTGAPTTGTRRTRYKTPQDSFAARTRQEGDCLVWRGTLYGNGYGEISVGNGKKRLVHRWAWEQENGPIPDGMQIDHMCHNRACVNVRHLRLATPKQNLENMLRGNLDSKAGGLRGVSWDELRQKWHATVGHDGRSINLGHYDSKETAAYVALGARLALFKFNLADQSILIMSND